MDTKIENIDTLIILGLGNPDSYKGTRHNIGRDLVEKLSEKFSATSWYKKGNVRVAESALNETNLFFIISDGYMNEIGDDFSYAFKSLNRNISQLVVIQDDLDIDSGVIKVSKGRGSGGHNGIKSIINMLSSKEFIRIRVGIGRVGTVNIKKYVLEKFETPEGIEFENIYLNRITTFIKKLISEGLDEATKECNTNE